MGWDVDEPFFVQDDILGQHPVNGATERRCGGLLSDVAADPTLHEDPRHAVARLDACHPRADLNDLPGAVRQRHELWLQRRPTVTALDDLQVAVIERDLLPD